MIASGVPSSARYAPSIARFARRAAQVTLGLLLLATALAFCARLFPLAELVANLRFQIGLAALVVLLLATLGRAWRTAAVTLALALVHLVPALVLSVGTARTAHPQGPTVEVATTNLWYCNKDVAALRAWLEKEEPDVVALFEVGEFWEREIAALAPLYPYQTIVPSPDGDPETARLRRELEDEPHEIISPYDVHWGLALIARRPLENVVVHEANGGRDPYVEAELVVGRTRVHVVALHPVRPGFGGRTLRRDRLLEHVARATRWRSTSVVLGDLNVTLYSPAYSDLLATSGLVDSRAGFGRQPSWNPPYHMPGHWLDLDHVLVHPEMEVVARELGPDIGSDHLPVLARLRLPAR